jgi:mannosyltransferase OCH1-like enzyme
MVLMKNSKNNNHEKYESYNKQLIPKIIHQTGPYPIPRKFKPNIKKIVTQNPEYKYRRLFKNKMQQRRI